MAEKYESQLQMFSEEINSLERLLVAGQRRQNLTPQGGLEHLAHLLFVEALLEIFSPSDILTHLKRFTEAFKHIAGQLYAVHEAINVGEAEHRNKAQLCKIAFWLLRSRKICTCGIDEVSMETVEILSLIRVNIQN